MNYHQRMGILSLKKRVNRDKCGLVCLGSLLSLRFFAIDEPRSPACALFATLFHNLFSLKNHKKWSYCSTADTVWTLLQRSTLPSTLILPSGKPRKQSHLSLEGRAQLKKVVIIDYICTNLQKNNWTRADWVLGQHCWLNKQIGCHDQHLLHTLSLTTHKISSRAVTAVDSMKKSGRFEWQEFFSTLLYYTICNVFPPIIIFSAGQSWVWASAQSLTARTRLSGNWIWSQPWRFSLTWGRW